MAVIQNNTVKIVPINRGVQTDVPGASKYGIIARFHGYTGVVGDGTGGVAQIYFNIPNLSTMFGNFAICTVNLMSLWMTANAAGMTGNVIVLSGEYTSEPGYSWTYKEGFAFPAGYTTPYNLVLPNFQNIYFRSAEAYGSSGAGQVQFTFSSNDNLNNYFASIFGLIWDERML